MLIKWIIIHTKQIITGYATMSNFDGLSRDADSLKENASDTVLLL